MDLTVAMDYNRTKERWEPKKCSNPNCENPSLILYENHFVCGTCCKKLVQLKSEKQMEVLKNLK